MPSRSARTAWNGTLTEGSGQVELSSSKSGTFEVSFPRRTAEEAGGYTSPEELIAAAHSSCYAMQLSAVIAAAGGDPVALEVSADVTLRPDPAGGFQIGVAAPMRDAEAASECIVRAVRSWEVPSPGARGAKVSFDL